MKYIIYLKVNGHIKKICNSYQISSSGNIIVEENNNKYIFKGELYNILPITIEKLSSFNFEKGQGYQVVNEEIVPIKKQLPSYLQQYYNNGYDQALLDLIEGGIL